MHEKKRHFILKEKLQCLLVLVGLPLRNNGRASPAARSVSFRVPEFN